MACPRVPGYSRRLARPGQRSFWLGQHNRSPCPPPRKKKKKNKCPKPCQMRDNRQLLKVHLGERWASKPENSPSSPASNPRPSIKPSQSQANKQKKRAKEIEQGNQAKKQNTPNKDTKTREGERALESLDADGLPRGIWSTSAFTSCRGPCCSAWGLEVFQVFPCHA